MDFAWKGKSDTSLVCLQVGQTSVGIGDEIKINISYLVNENFDSIEKIILINLENSCFHMRNISMSGIKCFIVRSLKNMMI